ncbi:hypothetical protein ACR9YC_07710 [Parasphingorhabdus sp. DH2-15]|uniref:hypothetical protein n=1 Tax=Parasphingorhabdus sp. DH2-15 TaxID=3444112 RepID=UPI003F6896F5
MTQFEFLFALYSLLLGFSMIELLKGLGRTVKMRLRLSDDEQSGHPVGILTPLLGLFVMLDLLSFWYSAWVARELVSISTFSLMLMTLFASCYYLAAYLTFPDKISHDTDFDAYYFRVRIPIISLLLFLVIFQYIFYAVQPEMTARILAPLNLILTGILILLMLGTIFSRSRPIHIALLSALIIRYVTVYMLPLFS